MTCGLRLATGLQMRQHPPPVLELTRGQNWRIWRRDSDRRGRPDVGEQQGATPVAFRAEALEAERVVPVGFDHPAVGESRLPFLAGLTEPAGLLGQLVRGFGHRTPLLTRRI